MLILTAVEFCIKDALSKIVLVAESALSKNYTLVSRLERLTARDNRSIT